MNENTGRLIKRKRPGFCELIHRLKRKCGNIGMQEFRMRACRNAEL
jgi:hypothetical protein